MKLHCLQHESFEELFLIDDWAKARSMDVRTSHLYEHRDELFNEKHSQLPSLDDFDMLVVMGGSMSVYDGHLYPWLLKERELIKAAIAANKMVLGVCLGAQQIAKVLGAKVEVNPNKEIGWFPIVLSTQMKAHQLCAGLNPSWTVLHWHSERFSVPQNAIPLASSEACENQGFLYEQHVLAMQFHLEMNQVALAGMLSSCDEHLTSAPFVQNAEAICDGAMRYMNEELKQTLFGLLDNWLALNNKDHVL